MDKDHIETFRIYAAYGRAVLFAHSLERNLVVLLSTRLAEAHHMQKDVFEAEQSKIKKMTLGRLIKQACNEFKFSPYWAEELDNVLFFRNRLVHDISEIITDHMWEHGDKNKIINEIDEIASYFEAADKYVLGIVFEWFDEKGVEKASLYEIAKGLIRN
ncbi:hypothetical protein [Desulfobacula phenolica]|uniref:DUF86 domain-containing protein n=1 Tax=Desulfobacula phenolica TaxID=90732 RepID=A0A1H2KH87_9BACT|nr:hypothetical protein [Desulfobacula phenolica]SDU67695.1 hypothetical protein SAMN04487931_1441 [Desulfobacula phenolica]